jgi:hypothetical protein
MAKLDVNISFSVEVEEANETVKEELATRLYEGGLLNVDSIQNIIDIQPTKAEVKQVVIEVKDFLKKEVAEEI